MNEMKLMIFFLLKLGINSSKKIIPEPTPLYDLFGKGIKKVSGGDSHSVALSGSWTRH
jgi:hypothetical protein